MTDQKTPIPENTWKCSNCGNTVVEIQSPEIWPCLQTEMRISERDLLSAGLRIYGNGQTPEIVAEIIFEYIRQWYGRLFRCAFPYCYQVLCTYNRELPSSNVFSDPQYSRIAVAPSELPARTNFSDGEITFSTILYMKLLVSFRAW